MTDGKKTSVSLLRKTVYEIQEFDGIVRSNSEYSSQGSDTESDSEYSKKKHHSRKRWKQKVKKDKKKKRWDLPETSNSESSEDEERASKPSKNKKSRKDSTLAKGDKETEQNANQALDELRTSISDLGSGMRDLLALAERFQPPTLSWTTINPSYLQSRNVVNPPKCKNCYQPNHDARICTMPCKLCGWQLSPPHPFYRCERYVSRGQQTSNSAAMPPLAQDPHTQVAETRFIVGVLTTKLSSKRIWIQDHFQDEEMNDATQDTQAIPPIVETTVATKKKSRVEPNPHPQAFVNNILRSVPVTTNLKELCQYAPSISSEIVRQLSPKKRSQKMEPQLHIAEKPELSAEVSSACPRTWVGFPSVEANCLLDSGSASNLASLEFIKYLGIQEIYSSNMTFSPFTGPVVQAVGKTNLRFKLGLLDYAGEFQVGGPSLNSK
ncbi:hypothetical protein NEOLI_005398 [Neolecta irregularis DAH-3]|uniref:Uncharacterized protein n=1 Tax=Neolecta irregularis (strain DAH-3) TaxID=1198029 RepID=A0A1U7LLH6_NEOID|nr:hypothetical protein NEOLI_005398 [Neolecta irregularis DAH-3]|eukprot:OLL23443.1 hypothetical protein NEOLI_005398 [Neolecta irregularis DAH-3]